MEKKTETQEQSLKKFAPHGIYVNESLTIFLICSIVSLVAIYLLSIYLLSIYFSYILSNIDFLVNFIKNETLINNDHSANHAGFNLNLFVFIKNMWGVSCFVLYFNFLYSLLCHYDIRIPSWAAIFLYLFGKTYNFSKKRIIITMIIMFLLSSLSFGFGDLLHKITNVTV